MNERMKAASETIVGFGKIVVLAGVLIIFDSLSLTSFSESCARPMQNGLFVGFLQA